jgi:imidazole glycerol-phosphate synthase subunit HisF
VNDILQTRVIPVLLLLDKGLVKTIGFENPTYVGDPINAVHIFNEKEVDELIFLDITSAKRSNTPDVHKPYDIPFDLVRRISEECSMPLAFGGGVRTIGEIQQVLATGVEKVVLNSSAVETPKLISSAAERFGNQSIVVSIDVKRNTNGMNEVYSHGGKKQTGLDPVTHAWNVVSHGAGEILINAIEKDGTMQGYDLALIHGVASAVPVPVIACGGAGNTGHFTDAISAGASAVAAGSMFVFHGRRRAVLISYPDRVELDHLCSSNHLEKKNSYNDNPF